MIVADVNLIACLLIDGPLTEAARTALSRDPHWIAPVLWRHEFLNILATCVREGKLAEGKALVALANAPSLVQDESIDPLKVEVLRLSIESRVATYDCEYVVLARRSACKLVTADKQIIARFPDVAVSLSGFAGGT